MSASSVGNQGSRIFAPMSCPTVSQDHSSAFSHAQGRPVAGLPYDAHARHEIPHLEQRRNANPSWLGISRTSERSIMNIIPPVIRPEQQPGLCRQSMPYLLVITQTILQIKTPTRPAESVPFPLEIFQAVFTLYPLEFQPVIQCAEILARKFKTHRAETR